MNEDKELEEAIMHLNKIAKEYKTYGDLDNPEFEDIKKIPKSVETVLQALEKVTEERDIYKEEHNKITKALNLKEGSFNPPAELVIESLKKALKDSIPKKKLNNYISKELEMIESNETINIKVLDGMKAVYLAIKNIFLED